MDVRIDQRRERPWTLHGGIEIKTQLAQHGQVRSKSRHSDDLVEWAERPALRVDKAYPRCVTSELACQKAGHQAQPPRLDEVAQAGAQAASGRERVGIAAAVHRTDVAPAHGPGDRCPWFGQGEIVQVEQGVERGVPTPNDQGGAPSIATTVDPADVGDSVEHARAGF